MIRRLPVLAALVMLAGCGAVPASPVAATVAPRVTPATSPAMSPATSPTARSTPLPPSPYKTYGVLVDRLTLAPGLVVNVVGTDGRLFASLRLRSRTPISNAKGHAIELPSVSTSSTSLYSLDGDSSVLVMRLPDGKQSAGPTFPVSAGMEVAFAVSPDDRSVAFSVLDFNRSPVHVTLYTDAIGGGSRKVIYESDSNYVWPVAWHDGLLVLAHAYGPFEEDIAKAAPGRDNPYSAVSYHVVDPTTATRRVLMGACTVSGALSAGGSACIQGGTIRAASSRLHGARQTGVRSAPPPHCRRTARGLPPRLPTIQLV